MSKIKINRRKYVRISDEDWSKARDDWASGEMTLVEIADRTGVSIRSLQNNFDAHGIAKGSAVRAASSAAALAAVADLPADLGEDPKAIALEGARRIERAVLAQLALVESDPSSAFRASSAFKAFDAAASTLSRVYSLKREILGFDNAGEKEIPALTIRFMNDEDVAELRQSQEEYDEDDGDEVTSLTDDNDVLEIS